jgi:hypothetical protein
MEKLYLGVDLHKRSCWVTVLDADGHLLESRRLGTEKWDLLEYFGKVRKPAAVAVEATFNWYYFLNAGGADTRLVVSAISRSERLLVVFIASGPLR